MFYQDSIEFDFKSAYFIIIFIIYDNYKSKDKREGNFNASLCPYIQDISLVINSKIYYKFCMFSAFN